MLLWPSFVAYLISLLTIGAAWLGHTALTDRLQRSDSIFLRLNPLLLLVVAFLPFPPGSSERPCLNRRASGCSSRSTGSPCSRSD